ncbi:chitinase [Caloramator quimbayensis]|uniref:chitinase n=1 Tax=Caloramator quimbayensis TaxID=1147123 RepID=A0A1T4WFL2_9CLOT|nr:glycoside hydrolase family 18 protein [Caloramator quimbayensis]SKA76114.1 chitinase [Caloramator quimbayensis]
MALKIIAYLDDSKIWDEKDIKTEKLTHINYAFAHIKDGKVSADLKKIGILEKIKHKNPDIKILISIGGWGADGFSDAALNCESREIFSDSAVKFMKENGFDGIDLDWEYPCWDQAGIKAREEDKFNFTLMLKNLREKLDVAGKKDGRYYLLTIASGAIEEIIMDMEMPVIHKYLDFINVMTYDLRGSFTNITGHHANLLPLKGQKNSISAHNSIMKLKECKVPSEKIVIGAAFYGRMWKNVKSSGSGLNETAKTTGEYMYDYTVLLEDYINKNGYKRYWDDDAKACYLFNGENFISYEDEESIENKCRYVMDNNLGGIMFWEYSLDKSGTLLDKIYKIIDRKFEGENKDDAAVV